MFGVRVYVFLCLYNSTNNLSPTPFKNQYFSLNEHTLYNKILYIKIMCISRMLL